jgi:hypothetical protein
MESLYSFLIFLFTDDIIIRDFNPNEYLSYLVKDIEILSS